MERKYRPRKGKEARMIIRSKITQKRVGPPAGQVGTIPILYELRVLRTGSHMSVFK